MKSTAMLATLTLLAASFGGPLLAGDRDQGSGRDRAQASSAHSSADQGMQAVANAADTAQPGFGWRYFSDPVARRAVVISPQGAYYLSRGKGLRWVTATQPNA